MGDASSVYVPMENKLQLENASVGHLNVPYREIIGSLMFLAGGTRLARSVVLCELSK